MFKIDYLKDLKDYLLEIIRRMKNKNNVSFIEDLNY
jgi:hypothetical protein